MLRLNLHYAGAMAHVAPLARRTLGLPARAFAAAAVTTPLPVTAWRAHSSGGSGNATTTTNTASAAQSSSSSFEGKGGSVDASADTHPDFQPRPVTTAETMEERLSIMQDIRETIRDEPVVVFIKGLPECPVCSFSKKLIDILDALGLEYTSFDVLAHPIVRSYVKEVSEWSTIPQLFVKGEFVGGVDVVAEMAKKGHLQMLLEKHGVPHKPYHF